MNHRTNAGCPRVEDVSALMDGALSGGAGYTSAAWARRALCRTSCGSSRADAPVSSTTIAAGLRGSKAAT